MGLLNLMVKHWPGQYSRLADLRRSVWSGAEPGRPGYVSCDEQTGDALLTYCDDKGIPVRQVRYHHVGPGRHTLLALHILLTTTIRVSGLKHVADVVIADDFAELHAGLYLSPTRRFYLNIPSRGWFVGGFERPGYLYYRPSKREAVLTYCDSRGFPVRHVLYDCAGYSRRTLLALGARVAWLRSVGQVVIDADFEDLHAWLYLSRTGKLYVNIPSHGWFIGGFDRRAPEIGMLPQLDKRRE